MKERISDIVVSNSEQKSCTVKIAKKCTESAEIVNFITAVYM